MGNGEWEGMGECFGVPRVHRALYVRRDLSIPAMMKEEHCVVHSAVLLRVRGTVSVRCPIVHHVVVCTPLVCVGPGRGVSSVAIEVVSYQWGFMCEAQLHQTAVVVKHHFKELRGCSRHVIAQ